MRKRNEKGRVDLPLVIHSIILQALLRCTQEVLSAKIINVSELLCFTFGPQFVVCLHYEGNISTMPYTSLPSMSSGSCLFLLSCMLCNTLLSLYFLIFSAEFLVSNLSFHSFLLDLFTIWVVDIEKRFGKGWQCTKWGGEGWMKVTALKLTVFMCLPQLAFGWLLNLFVYDCPRLEDLKAISSLGVPWNSPSVKLLLYPELNNFLGSRLDYYPEFVSHCLSGLY